MESLYIRDFRFGLDRRKSELTQRPGTLEELTNGFINQGGEIQNRRAFVRTACVAGTFGLQSTSSGLYTFGSKNLAASHPVNIGTVSIVINVNYQQLKHPQDLFDGTTDVVTMTEVVYSTEFRGKAWVVAKFGSSGTFGYYDGTLVYDFTNGYIFSFLNTNDEIATFIEQMIDRTGVYTASTSTNVITVTGPVGQPFATSAEATTAGSGTLDVLKVSDPIAATSGSQAIGGFRIIAGSSSAGTNKINAVKVNSVTITSAAVDWTANNETTAALLASNINAYASNPEYTAEASGDLVTIKAALSVGDTPNGFVVRVEAAGNVCVGRCILQVIATTGFTSAVMYANGTDISGTVNYSTSPSVTAAAIATAIRANTGTHGYLAVATGAILYISKATTESSDAPIPVVWTITGGNSSNTIIDVETGGGGIPTMVANIYTGAPTLVGQNISTKRWRFTITLSITGGLQPYQTPIWFGGTVVQISFASYYIDVTTGQGLPPPAPPHVYCTVQDATGLVTTSNVL